MQTVPVLLLKEKSPRVKRVTAGALSYSYNTQTVNAIKLPDEPVIAFHPQFTSGLIAKYFDEAIDDPDIETVTLKESRASRLGKFCADFLTRDDKRFFTCKSFMNFVCGFSDKVEPPQAVRQYSLIHSPATQLLAGEPYAAFRNYTVDHAILGTDRPDYGFSIMGQGGPLEVTSLSEVTRLYNPECMRRISGTLFYGYAVH
jgi:hypothetical protein